MRKGVSYLIVAIIIAIGIVFLYYWGGGPTGFAVFEEENLISPQNTTYNNATQLINVSVGESIEVILYNWNGTNITYPGPHNVEFNEGSNTLTIWANDSEGNVSSISVTFTIDTTEPEEEFLITIHSPLEDEEYDIEEIELNVNANKGIDVWWYVLNDGDETVFTPNTTITAAEENILTVYANDTKGNIINASVSFDVVIPSCSADFLEFCNETECAGEGGYWYDGTCNAEEEEVEELGDEEEPEEPVAPPISFTSSTILPLYLNPGSSQESSVSIKNTGETALSSCILKLMGGELDSWISVPEEIININPNQEQAFSFSVIVPEGTAEDSYSLKIATQCLNMYQTHNFVVNVVEKKLEFGLISADRIRDEMVRVIYSLEELSGEDQDVEIGFSLLNENNQEVATALENQSIGANSLQEFSTDIEINESLLPINETTNETMESSELTLVANFNSQIYSSSVMEKITLGAAPIGGFAIFAGVGAGEAIIFVVVLLVLVFIFVFARRMRKRGKTLKDIFKKAPKEGPQ